MAGPSPDKSGGGTDFMCMPLDPTQTTSTASQENSALLKGTEIFSTYGHGKNLKCAVCAPKYRSAVMTMPGKNVCPAGWVKEYAGKCL